MTDNITDRIAATTRRHREELHEEDVCICGHHGDWATHVAKVIVEQLPAWDLLMSILDHTYPAAVFPTQPDTPNRDPGPRIVSLIRRINEIRDHTYNGDDDD